MKLNQMFIQKKPNYGFPVFNLIVLMIFGILIGLLSIILIALKDKQLYTNIFLTFLICFLYFLFLIFVKKRFSAKRLSLLDKMVALADLSGTEKILDLGTGSGPLAIGFAKQINRGKVYGIDRFSLGQENAIKRIADMIRINYFGNDLEGAILNAKLENVSDRCFFIEADLTQKIDFEHDFFDVIVSSQALPFISINNQNNILDEIDRVLRKEGRFVFFESRSFKNWDVNIVKDYFTRKGYTVKVLPIKEFIGSCILFGKKNS
jgi:ubiquinone/menaquinone biosynthesis C-methylase UbiE